MGEGSISKTQIHADAWGVRKLISHTLRSLRLARIPRELRLHWVRLSQKGSDMFDDGYWVISTYDHEFHHDFGHYPSWRYPYL